MAIRNILISVLCYLLSGCSDYQTGYREGYEGHEKQWIVIGRNEYLRGYKSGLAEKFQQDWELENPVNTDALHCPSNIARADPLMFLPIGYREIETGLYSR